MFDYPSMTEQADSPMLTRPRLDLFQRLAVPPGSDACAVSPLYAELAGLAPALVLIPTVDPVADQGRRYAERLRESGTPVRRAGMFGEPHAFLTLPGLVSQAKAARAQMVEFLTDRLVAHRSPRQRR